MIISAAAVWSLILLVTATNTCKRVITVNKQDQIDSQPSSQNNTQYSSILTDVLTHLQSNDCIDIVSTQASLHKIVMLKNIFAVTIRGWDNTIVMCNNTGGIYCLNCRNVVIEGITWDQCGDPQKRNYKGGINFNKASNLVIKSCTFQCSKVRALSLVTISGFVHIINSNFVNNADNDTITCFTGPKGYQHCTTINYTSTGGVLIEHEDTINYKDGENINIYIDNCIFYANGHFGTITDLNNISSKISPEVSCGAGLSIYVTKVGLLANVTIKNTSFSLNRGSSGAGAYIHVTGTNPNVVLTGLKFYNNSVVKFYDNASALTVFYGNYNNARQSLFSMSLCDFFGNHGGRNMVSYVVVEGPSLVSVSQCTFLNNWDFGAALVELNMRSKIVFSISYLNFSANTGRGAIIYLHMHSINILGSIFNMNIVKNFASSVYKRGGLIYISISHDNSTIQLSRVNARNNYFSSNGDGIYIIGSFLMTCQLHFQDSNFKNNVGYGSGSVIYSSLTCKTDTVYFISIVNCTFISNKGKSIVYVASEYYLLPTFLVLNGIFEDNTGTPLELFNTILVGNGTTRFNRNKADAGAALRLSNSYILLNYSTFQLDISNNFANAYGGGIFIDFSLSNKDRSQCHWLLYPYDGFCRKETHGYKSCVMEIDAKLFCDLFEQAKYALSSINIANNTALLAGSAIFYSDIFNLNSMHRSISSLNPLSIFHIPDVFFITPNVDEPLVLATQPQRLQLADPAKCNSDYTACNITGLTLGKNIEIPANITGYNDEPSEAAKFFIDCIENCVEFSIIGGPIVLVSNRLSGISVIGQNVKHNNASVTIRLYSGTINLNLSVDIFPCHLGYTYNQTAKQCYCYTVDNVISCTVNTTIKKDHWFGMIDEKATVSLCPSKYCNLSRTEIGTSKYFLYHLQMISVVYTEQDRLVETAIMDTLWLLTMMTALILINAHQG